jgi:hypothetical protein
MFMIPHSGRIPHIRTLFAIIYLDHSLKLYRKNLRGLMIC